MRPRLLWVSVIQNFIKRTHLKYAGRAATRIPFTVTCNCRYWSHCMTYFNFISMFYCCGVCAPQPHHNNTTTTPQPHHNNTTTTPQQHHNHTTTTPQQHHNNTTTYCCVVVVVLLWCCCGAVVVLLWCCCGVVVGWVDGGLSMPP